MNVEQFIKLKLYNELTVDDYIDIHNKNPNLILDIINKNDVIKEKIINNSMNVSSYEEKKLILFQINKFQTALQNAILTSLDNPTNLDFYKQDDNFNVLLDYFGNDGSDFSSLLLKFEHENILFTNNYEQYKNNSKFISSILVFYFSVVNNYHVESDDDLHFHLCHYGDKFSKDSNIINLIKNNPNNFFVEIQDETNNTKWIPYNNINNSFVNFQPINNQDNLNDLLFYRYAYIEDDLLLSLISKLNKTQQETVIKKYIEINH